MGQTYSSLKWKLSGRKKHTEFKLQQQADQLEKQNMSSLDFMKYKHINVKIKPDIVCLTLESETQRQTLKKIAKLKPHLSELNSIYLLRIEKRKTRIHHVNYCTKLLSQMRGNKLKKILIGCGSAVLENFSFYARSLLRLAPMATELVDIVFFKISHKHFGRILMSCNSTQRLCLSGCQVHVDNLDYLNHVKDIKYTRPLIKHIFLKYNTFIQPEEDNECLDGLMQKMAKSRLNTCLLTVEICPKRDLMTVHKAWSRKEYKLGDFNVTIF
ncbi:unnamed protein product [Moneuplotes crassus]|uniref:Uncharacterized protein n=1 Tax=Euplotes crassus TaxID=5936 RepID=A0AAD2D321_EUPCR|nr:unnamed protein product [Moneuplotes crassus]